jgi:hypothetical protein
MLESRETYYKKRNILIVSAIGFLVIVIILFRVLFPVFSADSKDKDTFLIRDIGGKKYLEIKIKNGYPFHKLVAKLKLDNPEQKELLGKIYQDELGLYPLSKSINSQEQLKAFLEIKTSDNLKNGELIQSGNSVYYIEQGRYRAFSNAETFDTLGFDWEKVEKSKAEFLGDLEKEKNITLATTYLPGSFVKTGKKLYLLGDKVRYEIDLSNKSLIKFIEDNFSIIEVDRKKLAAVGQLSCQRNSEEMVCKFVDNEEKVLPRASILIEITDKMATIKGYAKVYTFNKFNSTVAKITLRNIKGRLIARYADRLGISN